MTALAHRYDFVLLFDVTDGNPNGDLHIVTGKQIGRAHV